MQGLVTPLTIQRPVKTSFDSQHVQRLQTLVKSSWEHFYQIYSSLWGEMIWKRYPWLKFVIIGLFVNTWTADYKYLVTDFENLSFPIQIQLSSKRKNFLSFLFHLWNLHQILNIFKTKEIVIGNVFPKLATFQGLVTSVTTQLRLKTSLDSQHVKPFQTLVKSLWEHFYHIFSALWVEMIWKISPWFKFEILGLFSTRWTVDYKYPVTDCENLQFPIQIQAS